VVSGWGEPWREPPAGSRGRAPGQGVRGAESILVIGCPTEPANLAPVRENSMLCYGPLVSVGGPECMVPPTPSLGGRLCLWFWQHQLVKI